MKFIEERLQSRINENALRKLSSDRIGEDFFSNDYLGLAQSAEIHQAVIKDVRYKSLSNMNGATGSRLLSGHTAYMDEIENYCAQFFQAESALIYSNGYAANLGLLSSIALKGDTIIYDEYSHASIKDGARLSLANRYAFFHNDIESLEKKLKIAEGNIFVVVESVYSMDGDSAPLDLIVPLCKKYNAIIIVDEAHSTGVKGEYGEGLVIESGWKEKVDIRIHTFGKAVGVHGACIVGKKILREYLINFSRSFIYSTAMAPYGYFAIHHALMYLKKNPTIKDILNQHVKLLRGYLIQHSSYIHSNSPIQVIQYPGNDRVKSICKLLSEKGFDIRPILSPTVKKGEERIRCCVHSFNKESSIKLLGETLITIK
jgi:8-amino-7-oxononanoate synthase